MHSLTQREALINEYKGKLFEYLLGLHLARHYSLEMDFQKLIAIDFRQRLSFYEDFLLQNDKELFKQLPQLASIVGEKITSSIPVKIEHVILVGALFGDADILLQEGVSNFKISLKLCKENAYVNTKSAGVKSFLEKYFSSFAEATSFQKKLNEKIEKDFYKMGHSLYEKVGLEYFGSFDESWTKAGLRELPGQLEANLSEIVVNYYAEQAKYLHECFAFFLKQDKSLFCEALLALMGVSEQNLLQVICFHGPSHNERYHVKEITLMNRHNYSALFESMVLQEWQEGKSSFDIVFDKLILQIRCKPMNKFTVPALKINCSVKKNK